MNPALLLALVQAVPDQLKIRADNRADAVAQIADAQIAASADPDVVADEGLAYAVFNQLRAPQPSLLEQHDLTDCTLADVKLSLGIK